MHHVVTDFKMYKTKHTVDPVTVIKETLIHKVEFGQNSLKGFTGDTAFRFRGGPRIHT